jgi:hypothetical protein
MSLGSSADARSCLVPAVLSDSVRDMLRARARYTLHSPRLTRFFSVCSCIGKERLLFLFGTYHLLH